MTMVASAVQFPDTAQQYWNTATSPLHPANYEPSAGHRPYASYVYGTLPLFVTRGVGRWVDTACSEAPAPGGQFLRAILLNASSPCPPGLYIGYNGIHLVGRALSTVVDLLALIGLALLGRCLYDQKIGLLAAFLYAFAALPIQHAHFFVVDSFATVFVVWTLYFSVLAVQSRHAWWLLPAGAATGLAVASKISVWPIAAVVALATFLHRAEDEQAERAYHFAFVWQTFAFAVGAGVLAALGFRSAQPYAFSGPGFWGMRLNQEWFDLMKGAQEMASGLRDVPFGHQWAGRIPIIFPGSNMIFWGLGLPFGVVAWLGWGLMTWRIIRQRQWQHLLIWGWGTVFFLYQGTQWVKSMRYILPIYPVFALFAAWISYRAVSYARTIIIEETKSWVRYSLRVIALSVPLLTALGAVLWGLMFLQIYSRPFTRVTASEWLYKNIPTALTLYTEQGHAENVPLRPGTILSEGTVITEKFTAERALILQTLTLNKVDGVALDGDRDIRIRISADARGTQTLATAQTSVYVPGQTNVRVELPLSSPISIEQTDSIYIWLTVEAGLPIRLNSSVLANEHWDDALPVRLSGRDPYWNWYQGREMTPYDNDTLEKRLAILDWLDEADYLVLSSNRVFASIARLPMRYPLTVAYYDALFDGRLGYELAAEFVSYPTLGPCQFPDQENPFNLMTPQYTDAQPCSIPYPYAEEAYSVYDHPTVLIFAKTGTYSYEKAAALLPESLLDDVQWMTPLEATRGKRQSEATLLLDSETALQQASAGTWSDLFNRQALKNRYPLVAAVWWWLLLWGLGILAFPWLYKALPNLRYRGYGVGRIVGLVAWAYVVWLLASVRVLAYTRGGLWAVLVVFAGISGTVIYKRWPEYRGFFIQNWRALLRVEIIFLVLYTTWLVVRYLNPDLWHPIMGGEKPMDFAYFNAVIKSKWFPPYDPWFAGGTMNYYYFGFVMVASLTKALGIMPSIAYNLIIPSFFAMTGVGAYTIVTNLAGKDDDKRRHYAGFWGVLFVIILGNLGEVQMVFQGLAEMGNVQFESLIPGYQKTVSALVGLWRVIIQGQILPFRPEWWYWNATRVVPTDLVINEFPAFTFLYGDLHAHMLAFPLTQIALAVALQWGLARPSRNKSLWAYIGNWRNIGWGTFILGVLAAGALRVTNTWDYPTYVGLMTAGCWMATFLQPKNAVDSARPFAWYVLFLPLLLVLGAELLFLPFSQNYAAAYTTFEQWKGSRTPSGLFLVMYGQFLFPLSVGLITYLSKHLFAGFEQREVLSFRRILWVGIIPATLLVSVTLSWMGVQIAWLVVPLGVLAAMMVLSPGSSSPQRLLWFWVGTALVLCLVVEVMVLKGDIGRMNTVFKFYLQVWMLLALSAAVATEQIFHRASLAVAEKVSPLEKVWLMTQDLLFGGLVLILAAMAMYPILAIPARVKDRWQPKAPHSLDGMAFLPYTLQYEHGGEIPMDVEYRVIRWFQDNVAGTPTIIEGQAEREYLLGNRISVYTGLPTVIAWRWHQVQQRMVMPGYTVEGRQQDVRNFYNTTSPDVARTLLTKYAVDYVVLTPYERAYMLPEGAWKFTEMVNRGWLRVAYQEPDAVVYAVNK